MVFERKKNVEQYSIDGYHRPFTSTRSERRGAGDEIHESVSVKTSEPKRKRKLQFLVFTANLPETENSI